jgi:predicted  nucleic acid-binding Zn-ribbon protein
MKIKHNELKDIENEISDLKNKITDCQSKIDSKIIHENKGQGSGEGQNEKQERHIEIMTLKSRIDSLGLALSTAYSRRSSYSVQKTAESSKLATWLAAISALLSAITAIVSLWRH